MKKYGRSAEPQAELEFDTLEDFLIVAESKINYSIRFHFTNSNGSQEWISLANACEAARRISLFLSSPERLDSAALNDGRTIVAQHNLSSLVQHMRWFCGLDHDSRPRPDKGSETRPSVWPETAKLWFWSNGGPGLMGLQGTYLEWSKRISIIPSPRRAAWPEMPEMPQPLTGDECFDGEMVHA